MDEKEEYCNVFSDKSIPVLRGEDAIRFHNIMEENKNKKVDPEVLERMRNSYESFIKTLKK